uniref:Uncharacterized protein n=1 Tax=Nelumbo nucifera TaxID=4432 RepID=A0A822YVI1_NELNU|nr:TPA_asm: hypothetical protein HUJ06_008725 [Nelumbo nucifera]
MRLYKRKSRRTRKRATPTGDPLRRWIESGSPVEKMLEITVPRSDDRNCMRRSSTIGTSSRPTGLKISEIAPVSASPCSLSSTGTTTTRPTTTASNTPCGAPRLSSIISSSLPSLVGEGGGSKLSATSFI